MSNPSAGQMMSIARALPHTRSFLTRVVAIGFLGVALAIPRGAAFGMSDEITTQQRTWLPASSPDAFSGEIRYEFDTAVNKTTARFVASLGAHGLLGRLLLAAPEVHTLVATYKFAGANQSRVPDTIRLSLKSDEYVYDVPENRGPPDHDASLVVSFSDRTGRYPLAIAQRIDVMPSRETRPRDLSYLRGMNHRVQMSPSLLEAHIARTTTAWLPICDFLDFTKSGELHGTVAGLDFTLDRDVIAGLREFASQMGSRAEDPIAVDCPSR